MSWQTEYLANLQVRDSRELANKELYDAYARLANKTAALQNQVPESEQLATAPVRHGTTKSPGSPAPASVPKLREDLLDAQRSREQLQNRLDAATAELHALEVQSKVDARRIRDLTSEKAALTLKLKDRDEELRGKTKLLDDVQDETVSLTLQLNVSEEQNQKLRKENDELVKRWMKKMGEEANAMNRISEFS